MATPDIVGCSLAASGKMTIVRIPNYLNFCVIFIVYSSLISRNSKLQIYRTLVPPVVTYGPESWTLTMEEERALAVFERHILRKIYGPVKENELWRIRLNDELEDIIKVENIVRFIKCQRIRWLGHIERMQDTAIPKKDVRKAVCNKTKRKTKNEMAG